MTSKRMAQTNQQQKSEKPQESGILQRAAVRPVSDAGMQSTDDKEAQPLSNSAFSKDFSRVPISTTKPQQFQAINPQSHPVQPIQAKLTIGEPGDRYEQEADRVASKVVQRINAPASAGRSVQRQEKAEKDIQAKPEITSLQRRSKPEEELQAKLTLQRREAIAGGEASTDLESTINRARGSGQPLEAGLKRSMGQAMGAEFSGVRVHTDIQADHLNQSIQAKAFTTGQDVFFRQGEYNPGSRGGQELIAHELTHVVQQNASSLVQKQIQRTESTESSGKMGTLPAKGTDSVFGTSITEKDAIKITDKLQEYVNLVVEKSTVLVVITLGAHNLAAYRGNPTSDPKADVKLQSEPQLLQDAKEQFTRVVSLQFDPGIGEIKEEEGNIIRVKIDAAFPLLDYGENETQVYNKIKEIIDELRNKENSGFILINTITDSFYPMLSKIIEAAIPTSRQQEKGYRTAYINSYFAKDKKFRIYIPLNKKISYNKEVTGSINLSHVRDIESE
ncbi:eCIS core domain-containing protein [Nostoc sp.]|uniref:eCIS core domain-containing protein n=1 Tax=Nostoc sp. TaxID=1180 RepID=UPI002FFCE200